MIYAIIDTYIYVRKPGIFGLKLIFKHAELYTFSETANISKENGVYSFLKLILQAKIFFFKDSYLRIHTFEKMAFKVLVPFFVIFFHISTHKTTSVYQLTCEIKWNIIIQ